jgi:hypothetical protein
MVEERDNSAALKLRQAGVSYELIAGKLGYANADDARDAVITELERMTKDVDAVAAQINVEQLDSLLMSLWTEAKAGNPRSVDQILRILDRKERLEEKLKSLRPVKPKGETRADAVLDAADEPSKPEPKKRGAKPGHAAFGGGKNVPGSTQPGDVRSEEEKRAISRGAMGNRRAWKTGANSRYIPSLYCNSCPVVTTCVHYSQDSVCLVPGAFRALAEEFGDGTPETIIAVLKQMIADNLERLEIGRAAEYAAGGKLAREVTALSNRIEKSLKLLMALYGRYDVVGGRRVVNVTQQNLIIGGEVAQTTIALLKLPQERRLEFLEKWQGNLQTQREILEESGVDVSGLRGFGGVASMGGVLARLEAGTSGPPGVDSELPGRVEGRGTDDIDVEWQEVK